MAVASGCLHLRLAWNDLTLTPPPEIQRLRRERGGRGRGGEGGGRGGGGGGTADLEARLAEMENTLPRSVVAKICRSLSIEEKCSQGGFNVLNDVSSLISFSEFKSDALILIR